MNRAGNERRLIVNADDFGRSRPINQAVERAHCEGILTSASLMVNGPAFADAVAVARRNPCLGVGLHLTLVCGMSTLAPEQIPGLVDRNGCFSNAPVVTGLRYFFSPGLKNQLEAEICAQFEKFHATGLPLDHVDGHLNMHMHPAVFNILMRNARRWKVRHLRLTRDDLALSFRMTSGRWSYRLCHAVIYRCLSAWCKPGLRREKIAHTQRVFGLLQSGEVGEAYVSSLLNCLPPGDSELYSHPSLDQFRHEFDALVSPANKALVREQGIQLIRYQNL